MKVEIYKRPTESASEVIEDKNIRIYYAGKWVDFRDGEITICDRPVPDKGIG